MHVIEPSTPTQRAVACYLMLITLKVEVKKNGCARVCTLLGNLQHTHSVFAMVRAGPMP